MDELQKIVNQDLLFDFYGDLLTEHQKRIYEEVVFNDYSISEVAKDEGVSRQSIHDMVRRTSEQLLLYEEKLKMVGKFREDRETAEKIKEQAEGLKKDGDPLRIEKILALTDLLLREE